MTAFRALVLWDIDRTLLTIGGVGRDLYAAAFREVTGRDLERMPDMAGKTDRSLVTAVLATHDVPLTESVFTTFCAELGTAAYDRCEEMLAKGRALPGAQAVVAELAELPGLVQSVVTGNLRPIAELKLALFGLDRHIDFEVGGYGSDDSDRAVLVRRALERAAAHYGSAVSPGRAVVIGDTAHDVAGARANGVAAVGVASGATSAEELAAAGADLVLESLVEKDAVMRAVRGLAGATGAG